MLRVRWPLRLAASEGGAVLVEFTIILIPFILLTFGTVEYGRISWIREQMNDVAITVARCMGVLQAACSDGGLYSEEKTTALVTSMAIARSVPLAADNIKLNRGTGCGGAAGLSEVRIDFSFVSAVPVVMTLLSGGLPLSAKACFPNQEAGN
jgi:Flp pilus assembly protein TadG